LSILADFRKPKEAICPDNGKPAQITLGAAYAGMTSAVGMNRLHLDGCSRRAWPRSIAHIGLKKKENPL